MIASKQHRHTIIIQLRSLLDQITFSTIDLTLYRFQMSDGCIGCCHRLGHTLTELLDGGECLIQSDARQSVQLQIALQRVRQVAQR